MNNKNLSSTAEFFPTTIDVPNQLTKGEFDTVLTIHQTRLFWIPLFFLNEKVVKTKKSLNEISFTVEDIKNNFNFLDSYFHTTIYRSLKTDIKIVLKECLFTYCNDDKKIIDGFNIFDRYRFEDGKFQIIFTNTFINLIKNINQNYTKLFLNDLQKFSESKYTFYFYWLFWAYIYQNKFYLKLPYEILLKRVGCKTKRGEIKNYQWFYFHRAILKPAIHELNKKSKFLIKYYHTKRTQEIIFYGMKKPTQEYKASERYTEMFNKFENQPLKVFLEYLKQIKKQSDKGRYIRDLLYGDEPQNQTNKKLMEFKWSNDNNEE